MGAQNIGFAIPINTVKSIVTELQTNGRVIRPWLGIKGKLVTDEVRNLIALPLVSGLLIIDVEDGSPAATIGLRAGELDVTIEGEPWILGGDILVAVNGQDMKTSEQYVKVLQQLKAKQAIELTLFRDGIRRTVTVTLGERPTPPSPPQHPETELPPVVPPALDLRRSNAVEGPRWSVIARQTKRRRRALRCSKTLGIQPPLTLGSSICEHLWGDGPFDPIDC